MENDIKQIHEDKREIRGLYFSDCEGTIIEIGCGKCTKIESYAENGPHCLISFLAVFEGDTIVSRVPASQVQVVYKEIV